MTMKLVGTLQLVGDPQRRLLAWARRAQGLTGTWPEGSTAIACVDGPNETIRAVMVVDPPTGLNAFIHIASDGTRRFATRRIIRGVFGYLFVLRGFTRATAIVPANNMSVQIMLLKLGFVFEGRMSAACDGQDGIVLGMTAENCHWIKGD